MVSKERRLQGRVRLAWEELSCELQNEGGGLPDSPALID